MDSEQSQSDQWIVELCNLLRNDAAVELRSAIFDQPSSDKHSIFRIEGSLYTPTEDENLNNCNQRLLLGYIDLRTGHAIPISTCTPGTTPESRRSASADHDMREGTPVDLYSNPQQSTSTNSLPFQKRRKVVGGLRLKNRHTKAVSSATLPNGGTLDHGGPSASPNKQKSAVRQVYSDTRFPQRKPREESPTAVLEPSSVDKFISGLWRRLHSGVHVSRDALRAVEPTINIHGGVSGEVFRAVNLMCLKYHNMNQSSRASEMIMQAHWIECYEARTAAIRLAKPEASASEARMAALREACAVLGWGQKELRNRSLLRAFDRAIWRGYKEIKDAGGWASLVFAGSGIYRHCKYRMAFDKGLTARLRQISSSLEVAADTLHPEWRQLLDIIGQGSPPRYNGHPHEWVTCIGQPALPLASTYNHLPDGFTYQFIDKCVLDKQAFTKGDPRYAPGIDQETCEVCGQLQSDDVQANWCNCFPELFGDGQNPIPVQLFSTSNGKNNGVIARCGFERGAGVGEFVGFITDGIEGLDVMVAGNPDRRYQIYQGQMGNFTRFINHSCRPNCQFQIFRWRGMEHVIVVSRGVAAGSEITVDYSDHYWKQLNKDCLCGEPCCRFKNRQG